MRGFVNPPSNMAKPCGLCGGPKYKKHYNALPPDKGVKMVDVWLCRLCDLTPAPLPRVS